MSSCVAWSETVCLHARYYANRSLWLLHNYTGISPATNQLLQLLHTLHTIAVLILHTRPGSLCRLRQMCVCTGVSQGQEPCESSYGFLCEYPVCDMATSLTSVSQMLTR